jgi:hypothetical protein
MRIVLNIPDNKLPFIMELIDSIPFIKVEKFSKTDKQMDTTDYLLSSATNKERLLNAIERSRRGEIEYHNLIEE